MVFAPVARLPENAGFDAITPSLATLNSIRARQPPQSALKPLQNSPFPCECPRRKCDLNTAENAPIVRPEALADGLSGREQRSCGIGRFLRPDVQIYWFLERSVTVGRNWRVSPRSIRDRPLILDLCSSRLTGLGPVATGRVASPVDRWVEGVTWGNPGGIPGPP